VKHDFKERLFGVPLVSVEGIVVLHLALCDHQLVLHTTWEIMLIALEIVQECLYPCVGDVDGWKLDKKIGLELVDVQDRRLAIQSNTDDINHKLLVRYAIPLVILLSLFVGHCARVRLQHLDILCIPIQALQGQWLVVAGARLPVTAQMLERRQLLGESHLEHTWKSEITGKEYCVKNE